MVFEFPNKDGAKYRIKNQYENYIGGEWTPPLDSEYFDNESPVIGEVVSKVPRSKEADVDKAVEAAKEAQKSWGLTSPTERSNMLLKIADRVEEHLEELAVLETFENGKAVRETLNRDRKAAALRFLFVYPFTAGTGLGEESGARCHHRGLWP